MPKKTDKNEDEPKELQTPTPKVFKFGRPPKYSEEILQQAWEYIYGEIDWTLEEPKPVVDAIPEWQKLGQTVPSQVGLALYLGIALSTLKKWCTEDDKKDFSAIVELVSDNQHYHLINNSLRGLFSHQISKMMLTKHGYSDKVENITPPSTQIVYIEKGEKQAIDDEISSVVDG